MASYIYVKRIGAQEMGPHQPPKRKERRDRFIFIKRVIRSIEAAHATNFRFSSFAISQGFQSLPPSFFPYIVLYISLITNMHVSCLTILMSLSLSLRPILQSFLYEISIERIDRPQSRRNSRVMKNHKRERETGEEPEINI
jgi:hypothetical protein